MTTRGTRPIFDSNAGRGSPSSPAPSSSSSLPFPSLACNSTARLRLCNKIRRDLLWIISTLPDHTRERELDFSKRFLYYRVYSLEEEEKRKKERERKRGFTMRFLPSSCISCRVICKKKISSLRRIEGGRGRRGRPWERAGKYFANLNKAGDHMV